MVDNRNADEELGKLLMDPLYEEEYKPPFLPVLIMVPFILPIFWTYHVRVTESKILFGYKHIFNESWERAEIQSAEVIEHICPIMQWGGYGVRKNLRWETGYITKTGPGVRVISKGGTVTVFNCEDPKLVCNLLNSKSIDIENNDVNDLSPQKQRRVID